MLQLAECLLQFESRWEQKEIEIETDIAENVSINADSELLSIVWNNLFSNAIKFTEHGGTVFVGLQADERTVNVTVRDTGCGIPAEIGDRIFEKGFSTKGSGRGVGMYHTKQLVESLGGTISFESEKDIGTSFMVQLKGNHV